MEWADTGQVIAARRHGETSVILEVMTRQHGRHLGLVRGGRSRTLSPVLQPGNGVGLTWRARLEEHLGTFNVEPVRSRAGILMSSPLGLHGVSHLAGLLHLLPERDPHILLHDMAEELAEHLTAPVIGAELLVRFELAILSEFGVGLDLSVCTLSGATDDLAYVSPRTGRAVSRSAGAQWRDRLLPLPPFLSGQDQPEHEDLSAGFRLTGHFLLREVFEPRGQALPDARERYLQMIELKLSSA